MWGVFEVSGYEYDLVARMVGLFRTLEEASLAASRRGDAFTLPMSFGRVNPYDRNITVIRALVERYNAAAAETAEEKDVLWGVFTFSGYMTPEIRFLGRTSEEAEGFLGGLSAAEQDFSFVHPIVMGARIEYPGPHDESQC